MELTEDQICDIRDILADYMRDSEIFEAVEKIREVLRGNICYD